MSQFDFTAIATALGGQDDSALPADTPPSALVPRQERKMVSFATNEYDAKTERLREKIATSDSVSWWDTLRLAGRSAGTANQVTLDRPEGGTIVGKGLGQAAGSIATGIGGTAATLLGDSQVTDFLVGAGGAITDASLPSEESTPTTRFLTDFVAGAAGVATDITAGLLTGTGPVGFALSAATRAAGTQRQSSLEQYLAAGLDRSEAEAKAEREAIAAGVTASALEFIGARAIRNLPGAERVLMDAVAANTLTRVGAAALTEGSQEVLESVVNDIYQAVERSGDERLKELMPDFASAEYRIGLIRDFALGAALGAKMNAVYAGLAEVTAPSRSQVQKILTDNGVTAEQFEAETGFSLSDAGGRMAAVRVAREMAQQRADLPPVQSDPTEIAVPEVDFTPDGEVPLAPENAREGRAGLVTPSQQAELADAEPYSRNKAVRLFRRYFTAGGDLPADVARVSRQQQARGRAAEATALRKVDQLNRAMQAAEVDQSQRDAINAHLNGTSTADQAWLYDRLPSDLKTIVQDIRYAIDENQDALEAYVTRIQAVPDGQTGTYLNRSYAIYDNPQEWIEDFKKSPDLKQVFREYARSEVEV